MKRLIFITSMLIVSTCLATAQRRIPFNAEWTIGEANHSVTLPHAWNEDDAYRVSIEQLPTDVVWYRKEFTLPNMKGKKVFIEFEGVRQAGVVYVNGDSVGISENGAMAFGFDITPYIKKGKNRIEVKTDNSWNYREKSSNSPYQWNDKNFNANYGGITKNVWLHITDEVYQTLPLYSNLQTTGTYVYLTDANIQQHTATVAVETEVKNDSKQSRQMHMQVQFPSALQVEGPIEPARLVNLQPGEKSIIRQTYRIANVQWWSIGEGNLYDVVTQLTDVKGKVFDEVVTRTGFRTTRFANGLIWLNGQVIQVKGYAQRTSNEWPAVGISVPAWLSDYSNGLMVESGANLVR